MDANMTTWSEDISPEHHADNSDDHADNSVDQRDNSDDHADNSEDQRDNSEDQSAGKEAQPPRSTPVTCGYDKEASSLAYSQSGARTEADNTISDPSAFGEFHNPDDLLT